MLEEEILQPEQDEEKELSLEDQLKALKDHNLRLLADLENARQRFEKERVDALKFGAQRFAADILSVADTLDMALQSIRQGVDPKTVIVGIEMVQKEIHNVFDRHYVKKFDSMGQVFDPQKHEAMLEVEEGDAEPNTVVREIKPGYTMHDKLLRPAMVGVKTVSSENS